MTLKHIYFFHFLAHCNNIEWKGSRGHVIMSHGKISSQVPRGSLCLEIQNSPVPHHLLNCANSNQQNSLSKHTDIHPVQLWQVVSSTSWFQSNFNINFLDSKTYFCPGRVARLVRALSQYSKVAGSVPGQGTHKEQPINALVSGITKSLFLCLSLKSIN